jgi:hypothetical protein
MSLHASAALSLSTHPAPFNPAACCTAWLRCALNADSGTLTVQDLMSVNPAVQATAARKPTVGAAANGQATLAFVDDLLAWPLNAGNNATAGWSVGFWMNSTSDSTLRRIISASRPGAGGGASGDKLEVAYGGARGMMFDLYASDGQAYRARSNTTATGNHFWTLEYQGDQATDATRAFITLDGTIIAGTTYEAAAGVQAGIPAALPAPTGSLYIGAHDTTPTLPFVGTIADVFISNRQWTSEERVGLRQYGPL